jgi:hypothetical protein
MVATQQIKIRTIKGIGVQYLFPFAAHPFGFAIQALPLGGRYVVSA